MVDFRTEFLTAMAERHHVRDMMLVGFTDRFGLAQAPLVLRGLVSVQVPLARAVAHCPLYPVAVILNRLAAAFFVLAAFQRGICRFLPKKFYASLSSSSWDSSCFFPPRTGEIIIVILHAPSASASLQDDCNLSESSMIFCINLLPYSGCAFSRPHPTSSSLSPSSRRRGNPACD